MSVCISFYANLKMFVSAPRPTGVFFLFLFYQSEPVNILNDFLLELGYLN